VSSLAVTADRTDGQAQPDGIALTLKSSYYQLADAAMHDELGDSFFDNLLSTGCWILPRLAANADSWWDNRNNRQRRPQRLMVKETARQASLTCAARKVPTCHRNGAAYTLTHEHPLGKQQPRYFQRRPVRGAPGGCPPNNQHA
jgi:penicillin amidase